MRLRDIIFTGKVLFLYRNKQCFFKCITNIFHFLLHICFLYVLYFLFFSINVEHFTPIAYVQHIFHYS